jgi:hypothetical protein
MVDNWGGGYNFHGLGDYQYFPTSILAILAKYSWVEIQSNTNTTAATFTNTYALYSIPSAMASRVACI